MKRTHQTTVRMTDEIAIRQKKLSATLGDVVERAVSLLSEKSYREIPPKEREMIVYHLSIASNYLKHYGYPLNSKELERMSLMIVSDKIHG